MKTRIFALAVALAMPALLPTAPAQSATLTTPLLYIYTMVASAPPFSNTAGGTLMVFQIAHIHLGEYTFRYLSAEARTCGSGLPLPGGCAGPPYSIMVSGNGGSVSFLVTDDTDVLADGLFQANSIGGVSLSAHLQRTVIETPIPPALPLFAAGLGIVTFLARRKKTKAVNPAATSASVLTGRASL